MDERTSEVILSFKTDADYIEMRTKPLVVGKEVCIIQPFHFFTCLSNKRARFFIFFHAVLKQP